MRMLLDKMFGNKKLSLLIPMLIALLVYVLFVFFGIAEDKANMIIMTPIVSGIWFFGMFLMVFIQVKNAICPEWFLNLFEFFATIFFGIYAIIGVVSFVVSGFQNYNYGMCLGFVTYSAIAWAHSKRIK